MQAQFAKNGLQTELIICQYEEYAIQQWDCVDEVIVWLEYTSLCQDVYLDLLSHSRNLTTVKTELSQLCKAVYNTNRSKSVVSIYWIGFEEFGTPLRHVTICSENDLKDIKYMFAEHSGTILRDIHIASFAVDWQPKVENLKQLSKQLGLD